MKRRFTKLQDSRQVGDARKRFFVALHQRFVALAKKPPALEASALRGAVRFASGTSCVRLALCGGAPPKHACHCEPPNMIWMPCVSAGKTACFVPPGCASGETRASILAMSFAKGRRGKTHRYTRSTNTQNSLRVSKREFPPYASEAQPWGGQNTPSHLC